LNQVIYSSAIYFVLKKRKGSRKEKTQTQRSPRYYTQKLFCANSFRLWLHRAVLRQILALLHTSFTAQTCAEDIVVLTRVMISDVSVAGVPGGAYLAVESLCAGMVEHVRL
jgi:hypothetical protein